MPHPKAKSAQSIRDNEKVQKRVKFNGEKLDYVSNYIDKYFGAHVTIAILTSLAKIVMGKHKVKLDRLARRNRAALLCWYAENWDIIHPILKENDFKKKIKIKMHSYPNHIDRSNNEIPKESCDYYYVDPTDLTVLLNYH
ncbi:hypothetical protein TVAG_463880 [Trichomonas vaginalis G3]|uniref:Uncharacterized protein n=2 Tax=Trichomonas vaginalis (strain ATCC PRA-98 / G3) TaxID=412133 RepID=A2E240_TRIV3|nr:hypothetical protein TVAG_463880 [Trichomonas vaginalis G3]|eukprot:XP_001325477.1 hypothetical protein [Trichomonas vaginalis G3]